jgi:SOS-response transcriptional repressor LexA
MDEEAYAFEARQANSDQSGLSVHAGFPNPSNDARSLSLDFNHLLVRHPSGTFVFRVRGTDWRRFGIWDGDLAIVDRLLDPRPTDLVVWHQEGEPGFGISRVKQVPREAQSWGIVTSILHQFRELPHGS